MPDHDSPRYPTDLDETQPSPALRERRAPTSAPVTASISGKPQPPRWRINPLVAGASALTLIVLAAGLFYVLAPRGHPHSNAVAQATATAQGAATAQSTATALASTGAWSARDLPANANVMAFALSDPRTGYFCANVSPMPATSSKWLYKTSDGGATWRTVAGITTPATSQTVSMNCAIFIDSSDAGDVFVELYLLAPTSSESPPVSVTLWRSRDGGASWRQMAAPSASFREGWDNIAVAGSRIIGLAAYDQQVGPVCSNSSSSRQPSQIDYLYASDDDGATWSPIGQSLISQGVSIIGMSPNDMALQSVGATLYVQTFCEDWGASTAVERRVYWQSTNGGVTWTKTSLPDDVVTYLAFTPSAAGGFYGVALKLASPVQLNPPPTSQTPPTAIYSSDSGATWKPLPTLSDLPGLKIDPGDTSGINWMTALPDGTMLAAVSVLNLASNTVTGEMFAVDPRAASPAWRPYATYDHVFAGGLAQTGQGLEVWGLMGDQNQQITYLSPLP